MSRDRCRRPAHTRGDTNVVIQDQYPDAATYDVVILQQPTPRVVEQVVASEAFKRKRQRDPHDADRPRLLCRSRRNPTDRDPRQNDDEGGEGERADGTPANLADPRNQNGLSSGALIDATTSSAHQIRTARKTTALLPAQHLPRWPGSRAGALSAAGTEASGRTNSTIVELNFSGSSTNASWPECSNHTSVFDGAVSASKYATLVSGGTQ